MSAFGGFEKTNLLPNLPYHGETTFLASPLKAKKSVGEVGRGSGRVGRLRRRAFVVPFFDNQALSGPESPTLPPGIGLYTSQPPLGEVRRGSGWVGFPAFERRHGLTISRNAAHTTPRA